MLASKQQSGGEITAFSHNQFCWLSFDSTRRAQFCELYYYKSLVTVLRVPGTKISLICGGFKVCQDFW